MAERLGNYEIIRRLAAGGMAEVLLAKQRGMGGFERLVCLKRILPHLSRQEDFLKMFQDEARIAANLMHPNIAQIYDIAQEADDFYIAMEYVRGEDLRRVYNQEVARGQTIPANIAAQVAMGAAAGLEYAHRQTTLDGQPLGLVHRDISPQNILVTYDGHAKLIDFGVAKAAGKLIETRSGVLKGKYSYMSPEQASGDPVDGRTDIFALGITLYEITTGTRLFKRDNELETLHAVIACNVTPPSDLVPDYDRGLESIIMKALAYDADDRFVTAGELEQALESYLTRGGFALGASHLASYMHDLFAEKLADEALFGGPPWSEPATASRLIKKKDSRPPKKAPTNELEQTTPDLPLPTAAQAPQGHLQTDEQPYALGEASADGEEEDWQTEVHPLEKTGKLYVPDIAPNQETIIARPTATFAVQAPSDTTRRPLQSTDIDLAMPFDGAELKSPKRPKAVLWAAALAAVVGLSFGGWWWRHHAQQASQPVATSTPTPDADAETGTPGATASLTVTAPIPMEVTLGDHYLGDTPLRGLALAPGSYRLKLESKNEGVTMRRNVRLRAGGATHVDIGNNRGVLSLTAKPWAWVQVGLGAPQETPIKRNVLEGDYAVTFECPNGQRRSFSMHVAPSLTESQSVDCTGQRP